LKIKTIERKSHQKGNIYRVIINNSVVEILFLFHAIERINRWNLKEKDVIKTLLFPEEVLTGHRDRYIAHMIDENHIIRAIYEYEDDLPVLITVYYPNKDRYFKGGNIYENKIFKGS